MPAVGHVVLPKSSFENSRKRDKDNFYPTPVPFIEWLYTYVHNSGILRGLSHTSAVLDVGSGTGHWGKVWSRGYFNVYGIEKNAKRFPHPENYTAVYDGDVMDYTHTEFNLEHPFDLVIGNPPYQKGTKSQPSTGEIIEHVLSSKILSVGGVAVLLLPANFLHSIERYNLFFTPKQHLRHSYMPKAVIHLANRINFYTEDGKGGSYPGEYVVCLWDKMTEGTTYTSYTEIWS